jgi:hypothetical protein
MKSFLFSDPMLWSEIKGQVWDSEDLQNKNEFIFLQGDIIHTTNVVTIGQARSDIEHAFWMIMNPTCEMVANRGTNRYFRVAPVTFVNSELEHKDSQEFKTMQYAFKLKKPNCFPISRLPGDDSSILGGYAYLETLFFLEEEKSVFATVEASLTLEGWHLFGAELQIATTRATIYDEEKIRVRAIPYQNVSNK